MQPNASQDASTMLGGDYNAVPYVWTAIVQSQPARLFALAKLFGLTSPAMETASILELGCASGEISSCSLRAFRVPDSSASI
jgi:hypothetical protein